jgi:hypothetical protein
VKSFFRMKQTFFSVLLFIVFPFTIRATHIIGGSFAYTYLGNDQYDLSLTLYRDCEHGVVPFDEMAIIGVYDQNWNLVETYMFDLPPDDTLNLQNTPLCFPPPTTLCLHRAVYHKIVTLPFSPDAYRILYQSCCRTEIITNLENPTNSGISYQCDLTSGNHSPVLKYALPYYCFKDKPFIYEAGATDLDGDMLVYKLVHAKTGGQFLTPPNPLTIADHTYTSGYDVAQMLGASPFPLTIDAQTGQIQALPGISGVFVVSFAIEEWRNGQKLGEYYNEIGVVIVDGIPGLSVSGEVTLQDSPNPIDLADVQLIQRNPFTDSLWVENQTTISLPSYLFTDTYTSLYYARAMPTPQSVYYADYWPTFHPNKLFWYEATEFEVCQQNASAIDIQLIRDSINLSGPGSIAGRLLSPNQTPIANFELWLMNAQQKPIAFTLTDQNGVFAFEHLPLTDFLLFSNQINAEIFNTAPPQLSLNGNQTSLTDLHFQANNTVIVPISTSSLYPVGTSVVAVVPNPALDFISIQGFAAGAQYKIFDATGYQVLNGRFDSKIATNDLVPGYYTIQLLNGQGFQVAKFVKL